MLLKKISLIYRKNKFIIKKFKIKFYEYNKLIPKKSNLEYFVFLIWIFSLSILFIDSFFNLNLFFLISKEIFFFFSKFLGLINCFLYSYRNWIFISSIETKKWSCCENLDDYTSLILTRVYLFKKAVGVLNVNMQPFSFNFSPALIGTVAVTGVGTGVAAIFHYSASIKTEIIESTLEIKDLKEDNNNDEELKKSLLILVSKLEENTDALKENTSELKEKNRLQREINNNNTENKDKSPYLKNLILKSVQKNSIPKEFEKTLHKNVSDLLNKKD